MTSTPAPRNFSSFILAASIATLALAGATGNAAEGISREEFQKMQRELAELRQEVKTLRNTKTAASPTRSAPENALGRKMTELNGAVDALRPGESKFAVTGSLEATFNNTRHSASNFSAAFEPIFLWHINDHLLVEAEVEMELAGGETETKLEYAQIDWSLNDNLTLIAGKFLNPMNVYVERNAPTWIRKLPDNPLGLYDGFLPESNVGLQLRGVYPIGKSHVNFAAYVANAPRLVTDDPEALGSLDFENFDSQADAKAYGGRIGLALCPNFEIGYGLQSARARGDGTRSTSTLLQSVDLSSYIDAAKGRIALLGQYSWSKTGDFTYDEDGSLGVGPYRYGNDRSGGYVQLSYRGKQWDSDFMNHLEFAVRGDFSKTPSAAPGGFDERRLTFGIDYWVTSATVFKVAYEIDHRTNGEPNGDGIVLQLSTGF
jgi:hypothetical protein